MPIGRTVQYGLRNKCEYDVPLSKRECSLNTYFTNTLREWNILDAPVTNSITVAEFTRKLLTSMRLVKNFMFVLSDICDIKKRTMLQLEISTLNEHRYRHNFQ